MVPGAPNAPPPPRSYAHRVLVALCGGVGAARMLSGLVRVVPGDEITAVVNVGDDMVLHGLSISPDLDTVTYTLAGMDNRETGWGVAGETWAVMDELARLGRRGLVPAGRPGPGDPPVPHGPPRRGPAAQRGDGRAVRAPGHRRAAAAGHRRPPAHPASRSPRPSALGPAGHRGRLPGLLRPPGPRRAGAPRALRRGSRRASRSGRHGRARPTPDQIVVCPSNPVVSIGPLLAVPGVEEALRARRDDVVAVSPIVAGAALKGPADRMLRELGTEPSVVGVARLYASWVGHPRHRRGGRRPRGRRSRRKGCAAWSPPPS